MNECIARPGKAQRRENCSLAEVSMDLKGAGVGGQSIGEP